MQRRYIAIFHSHCIPITPLPPPSPPTAVKPRSEPIPAEPAPSDLSIVKDCRLLDSEAHRDLPPVVPTRVGWLAPLALSAR